MSSNKHQRLKALEKLATIAKVKARAKAESQTEKEIQAKVAAMTDEELKAKYDAIMQDIKNSPPDPELANLTTKELIDKYAQLCKESPQ